MGVDSLCYVALGWRAVFEFCGSALVFVWSEAALSPALSGPGSHCAAVLSPPVSLSAAASSLV